MRTTEVKVHPKRVVISYSHGAPPMQSGRLLILSRRVFLGRWAWNSA